MISGASHARLFRVMSTVLRMFVFGYGSLLWNPGFEFLSIRPALAHGWRRSWCVSSTHHRGTPAVPGLVLGLLRGGVCVGHVFGIAEHKADEVTRYLKAREEAEVGYVAARIELQTPEGAISALCWVCDESNPAVREPTREEFAWRIVTARGASGTNADYVRRTAKVLESLQVPSGWPRPCCAIPTSGTSGPTYEVPASACHDGTVSRRPVALGGGSR